MAKVIKKTSDVFRAARLGPQTCCPLKASSLSCVMAPMESTWIWTLGLVELITYGPMVHGFIMGFIMFIDV